MNTKTRIAVGVIVLVAAAGAIYYALMANKEQPSKQQPYVPPVVEEVNTTITDTVGKTNPFDVKVNPYEGYKNPFAQE